VFAIPSRQLRSGTACSMRLLCYTANIIVTASIVLTVTHLFAVRTATPQVTVQLQLLASHS
jgi:hypothetical protein